MNSNKILQPGGLVSAPTQGQANRPNRLSAEVLTLEATIAKEVLRVVGFAEMTAANSHLFRKKVCDALKNEHMVVEIDLSQTTFLDAAGLGALFAVHILTRRRNGVVRLLNPTPPVQQVLDLVRAGQIFEIVHTSRPSPECTFKQRRQSQKVWRHVLRKTHRGFK